MAEEKEGKKSRRKRMKTKKNSDFKIGEIVVYPKHGVGEISKIETMFCFLYIMLQL